MGASIPGIRCLQNPKGPKPSFFLVVSYAWYNEFSFSLEEISDIIWTYKLLEMSVRFLNFQWMYFPNSDTHRFYRVSRISVSACSLGLLALCHLTCGPA